MSGLIQDLKSRGMLHETLVVWITEFGRKPGDASTDEEGRTHWSKAYPSWVAGGGFKGGLVHGSSDIDDLQARLLNQLGLDHTKLTFRHAGRDYRLTGVSGRVVKELVS